jgi:hypothetical protein
MSRFGPLPAGVGGGGGAQVNESWPARKAVVRMGAIDEQVVPDDFLLLGGRQ